LVTRFLTLLDLKLIIRIEIVYRGEQEMDKP